MGTNMKFLMILPTHCIPQFRVMRLKCVKNFKTQCEAGGEIELTVVSFMITIVSFTLKMASFRSAKQSWVKKNTECSASDNSVGLCRWCYPDITTTNTDNLVTIAVMMAYLACHCPFHCPFWHAGVRLYWVNHWRIVGWNGVSNF